MTDQPLSEKDRCKSCKTGLHLYCPHEVETIFNYRMKQAIQKTLKELKEKIENHKCAFNIQGVNGSKLDTDTWVERRLVNEFIDTTFKQNFGGLAE